MKHYENENSKQETETETETDINYVKEKKTIFSSRKRIYMTIKSFLSNIHIWLLLAFSIFIIPISHIDNLTNYQLCAQVVIQMITLIVLTFFSYFAHYCSHLFRNIFTIVHHYHHETDNKWLGDFLQINIEFLAGLSMMFLFDPFSVLFFFFLYTSIHNINYGVFHVNDVHERHHKYILTNIGPDICDILFDTKYNSVLEKDILSRKNINIPNNVMTDNCAWRIFKYVVNSIGNNISTYNVDDETICIENIYHILPNILGSLFITLIIKHLYNTTPNRRNLKITFITICILSIITHFIASVCIFANDDHPDKSLFI
jgi:hypothetical protein